MDNCVNFIYIEHYQTSLSNHVQSLVIMLFYWFLTCVVYAIGQALDTTQLIEV